MENFYNKVIFDITQLILNKNYKRAIAVGQFLLEKGFRTAQLIVTMSYAQRVLYGAKEAIHFLQQHARVEQSTLHQHNQTQSRSSPLIQLALSEYHIESQSRDLAVQNLLNLLKLTNTIQTNRTDHPRLPVLINQLSKSYQSQYHYNQGQKQLSKNQIQGQVQKLIQQINCVTKSYLIERDELLIKQGETSQKSEVVLKYGQYYVQYDQIKGRILTLLSEHIRMETNRTVGKRIKRKQNKFIKDNSSDQLKTIIINSKIQKQPKQQPQYQEIAQKQPPTKILLQHTNNSSRSMIIQASQMQQLQSLLVHVNGFVSYFKGRLRECSSTSRVKQLNFEDKQALGEQKQVKKQNNRST